MTAEAQTTVPFGPVVSEKVIGVMLNGQSRWMDVEPGTFEMNDYGSYRFSEADWPEIIVQGVLSAVVAFRVDGSEA